jgi:hypothetical protein
MELMIGAERRKPPRILRAAGALTTVAGVVLALWLKQPGWMFLVVAGIVVYRGGRLPKPHR